MSTYWLKWQWSQISKLSKSRPFMVWKTPPANLNEKKTRTHSLLKANKCEKCQYNQWQAFFQTTTRPFTDRSFLCSCHTAAAAPYTWWHSYALLRGHKNLKNKKKKHGFFKREEWQRGRERENCKKMNKTIVSGWIGRLWTVLRAALDALTSVRHAESQRRKEDGTHKISAWKMKEKERLVVQRVWINGGGH